MKPFRKFGERSLSNIGSNRGSYVCCGHCYCFYPFTTVILVSNIIHILVAIDIVVIIWTIPSSLSSIIWLLLSSLPLLLSKLRDDNKLMVMNIALIITATNLIVHILMKKLWQYWCVGLWIWLSWRYLQLGRQLLIHM